MPGFPLRVAVVACRSAPGVAAEDLYPDEDRALLVSCLARRGVEAAAVAWDDDNVDWTGFDAVLIRSTWDSVDRPLEYLRWARATAVVSKLINPEPALVWGLDKTYLSELQDQGIPIVPTTWVTDGSPWTAPDHEFVVKPSISGGGRETARYRPEQDAEATDHVRCLLAAGQTVMVQPHLAHVGHDGEAKLVFIGGKFSHAVQVGALLEGTTGVLDRPWEVAVTVEPTDPTHDQLDLAEAVMAAAEDVIGAPLSYARVDLMRGPEGAPCLAELEIIDPSLFLRLEPAAAHALADLVANEVG